LAFRREPTTPPGEPSEYVDANFRLQAR
jgi:hypothetical protein